MAAWVARVLMVRQAHDEGLSKPELIELVLKLQQPAKTSRTSSKSLFDLAQLL